MKQRCLNPNNNQFHNYGARGITVCDRWLDSFENFYNDMGEPPTSSHSLDRIDNDRGYSPDNCRWATPSEQTYNRRDYKRPKYKTEIVKDKVLRLHSKGLTTRAIASECGIGKTLAWKIVNGYG